MPTYNNLPKTSIPFKGEPYDKLVEDAGASLIFFPESQKGCTSVATGANRLTAMPTSIRDNLAGIYLETEGIRQQFHFTYRWFVEPRWRSLNW